MYSYKINHISFQRAVMFITSRSFCDTRQASCRNTSELVVIVSGSLVVQKDIALFFLTFCFRFYSSVRGSLRPVNFD